MRGDARAAREMRDVASHTAAITVQTAAIKTHPPVEVCAPSKCERPRAMKILAIITDIPPTHVSISMSLPYTKGAAGDRVLTPDMNRCLHVPAQPGKSHVFYRLMSEEVCSTSPAVRFYGSATDIYFSW